jgi:hypothetical protein
MILCAGTLACAFPTFHSSLGRLLVFVPIVDVPATLLVCHNPNRCQIKGLPFRGAWMNGRADFGMYPAVPCAPEYDNEQQYTNVDRNFLSSTRVSTFGFVGNCVSSRIQGKPTTLSPP